jgi:3-phenylpropionate/trans-cinnamate dioxygenase ferredoxin reductase subunit
MVGRHHRLEHWMSVTDQAETVARTILGDESAPSNAVPYFWSDQYDVKIQALGFIDASDQVDVLTPDGRTVLLYSREGQLRAAVGFSASKSVMQLRQLIANGAPLADAVARLAG